LTVRRGAAAPDVVFRSSPVSAVLLAADYRILDVNDAFLSQFGYKRARLRSLEFFEVVESRERVNVRHQLDELQSGEGIRTHLRLTLAGEDTIEVMAVFHRVAKSEDVAIIGQFVVGVQAFVDGEKERLLEVIERAAAEWRTTFDAVETPIVIVSGNDIIRINRAARMLAGKQFGEIIGQPLRTLGDEEPWSSIAELTVDVKEKGSPSARQVRDSSGRTLDLLAMPFPASEDVHPRVIITAWDVTALVELQARLEQERTMATMGALVAGVAHEVRNPLFAISATVDAMEQIAPSGLEEYFAVLREEIDRMTSLMQDLLAYGRRSTTPFQTMSIATVIEGAVRSCTALATQKKVTVHPHIVSGNIAGDRERLTRAVQNVINNAIQHSREGETVEVTSRLQKLDRRYVEIVVRDNGPGFNLNDLARVFEPFFSKRKGGTGLGLSLVQQIVTEHGGEVTARNADGGGGEVVIVLPLS
jgi:PAS domain S-box-containing protein